MDSVFDCLQDTGTVRVRVEYWADGIQLPCYIEKRVEINAPYGALKMTDSKVRKDITEKVFNEIIKDMVVKQKGE